MPIQSSIIFFKNGFRNARKNQKTTSQCIFWNNGKIKWKAKFCFEIPEILAASTALLSLDRKLKKIFYLNFIRVIGEEVYQSEFSIFVIVLAGLGSLLLINRFDDASIISIDSFNILFSLLTLGFTW